jgi:hypothetical protein
MSDGDRDIKGAVNNFEDDCRVLNRGGVTVLQTRGVGGGGIFDSDGGNMFVSGSDNDGGTDSNAGDWGTGTGGARLVLFSYSCLVWVLENAFWGLSFPYWHLYSFESDPFLHLLVECVPEGPDDSFIVISVVGIGRNCSV